MARSLQGDSEAGYKTIDEIGQERIRRAAAKLKEQYPTPMQI